MGRLLTSRFSHASASWVKVDILRCNEVLLRKAAYVICCMLMASRSAHRAKDTLILIVNGSSCKRLKEQNCFCVACPSGSSKLYSLHLWQRTAKASVGKASRK